MAQPPIQLEEQRRHFLQQQRKSGVVKRARQIGARRHHNHLHQHLHLNHDDEDERHHHNNNNESPPDKKVMPMLLHPPANLSSYAQHEPDSLQPLDFSVSGVSRYNGRVELARISAAGSGAGINGRQSALRETEMCSDQEFAGRTTSGSSSASNISDEGSPVHSPPVSPEPIQNREY